MKVTPELQKSVREFELAGNTRIWRLFEVELQKFEKSSENTAPDELRALRGGSGKPFIVCKAKPEAKRPLP